MTYTPSLTAAGYRLIAQSLGRALAYIQHELAVTDGPVAFRLAVDCLIRDFEEDNPHFDARRFRRVIEASRMSGYAESGDERREASATEGEISDATLLR